MSQAVAFEEVALESAGPGGALHWKMGSDGSWHAKPPIGGGAFDVIPTRAAGFHTWWLEMGRDGRTAGKATDLGVHSTLGAAFGAARDFLDEKFGGKRAAEEAPALRWEKTVDSKELKMWVAKTGDGGEYMIAQGRLGPFELNFRSGGGPSRVLNGPFNSFELAKEGALLHWGSRHANEANAAEEASGDEVWIETRSDAAAQRLSKLLVENGFHAHRRGIAVRTNAPYTMIREIADGAEIEFKFEGSYGVRFSKATEEKAAFRWAEVSFDVRDDASKFAKLIEKVDSTIVASHQGLIVTTNASGRDIDKVLRKHTWKEGYRISKNAERYDQAAECCDDDNCAHRHPKSVPTSPCNEAAEAGRLTWETDHHHDIRIWTAEGTRGVYEIVERQKGKFTLWFKNPRKTELKRDSIDTFGSLREAKGRAESFDAHVHASESVNVVHEASGADAPKVPADLQCTGNPEVYKQWVEFGDAFGPIDNTHKLYKLLASRLQSQDQEVYIVVVVDLYGHVRGISEVNRGERSAVNVSVTQIMRVAATAQGGTAFFCVHPHPSGKAKPSKADRDLTKTIERAADPHGDELKFIDHVVIGHGEFYSIKESKMHYETGKCCRGSRS